MNYKILIAVMCALLLSACGKGMDATLKTTSSEAEYKDAMAAAMAEMTPDQQKALQWAVRDYTFDNLAAAYRNPTPREVILKEGESYAKLSAEEIARATIEYNSVKPKLDAQDKLHDDTIDDIKKVEITSVGFKLDRKKGVSLMFSVKNGSAKTLGRLDWQITLDKGDPGEVDPTCTLTSDFGKGLEPSVQKSFSFDSLEDSECKELVPEDTASVKTAKIIMIALPDSAKDINGQDVIPPMSDRKPFEEKIEKAKHELAKAQKALASIGKE